MSRAGVAFVVLVKTIEEDAATLKFLESLLERVILKRDLAVFFVVNRESQQQVRIQPEDDELR